MTGPDRTRRDRLGNELPPRVWITVEPHRALIKGRGIGRYLKNRGWSPIYAGTVRAWIVDTRDVPDIVAHLEYHSIPTAVTEEPQT